MEKTALYRRIVAAFVVTGGHEQNPRAKRPRLDETRPVEQPVEEPRGSKGDVSHLKGPPTLKDEKEAESRFIRDHAGDDEAIVKYFDGMRQYGPRLGISRIGCRSRVRASSPAQTSLLRYNLWQAKADVAQG